MERFKHLLGPMIRILLGVGLIALLLSRVQWNDEPGDDGAINPGFRTTLANLNWQWALPALLLHVVPNISAGFRWWLLMRARGIEVSSGATLKLNFVGAFFNNIALGAGGGDLAKAYQVTRHAPDRRTEAVTIILLDRAVGLMALCVIAAACIFLGTDSERARNAGKGVTALLALGAVGSVFFFSRRIRNSAWFERLLNRIPFGEKIRRIDRTIHEYRHSGAVITGAVGLSWVGHVAGIAGAFLAGKAIGLDAGLPAYFSIMPIIWVLASVPLTPGGAGVMEFGFWWFHESLGCDRTQALALALLVRMMTIAASLPGGLVLLLGAYHPETSPQTPPAPDAPAPH